MLSYFATPIRSRPFAVSLARLAGAFPQEIAVRQADRQLPSQGQPEIRHLIDNGFQAFNAGRLSEACQIFSEKMLAPENDTTIGLTIAGAMTPAGLGGFGHRDDRPRPGRLHHLDRRQPVSRSALRPEFHAAPRLAVRQRHRALRGRRHPHLRRAVSGDRAARTDAYIRDFIVRSGLDAAIATSEFHYRLGSIRSRRTRRRRVFGRGARGEAGVPLYTSSPGDSSIGMNIAYHELMNGGRFMIDPNKDVNEVCAIVMAGKQNGCVILGGDSPKTFTCRRSPRCGRSTASRKAATTTSSRSPPIRGLGGLSGATPAEAVSWARVNPGVLPDTVVAYFDSTIAFPLFCEYTHAPAMLVRSPSSFGLAKTTLSLRLLFICQISLGCASWMYTA